MSNKPATAKSTIAPVSTSLDRVRALNVKIIAPEIPMNGKIRFSGTILGYSTERGKDDGREYSKFKGNFGGKFADKVLAASILYVPAAADEMLKLAFDKGDGKPLEFKLDIVKVADADPKNTFGYRWNVVPLGKLTDGDAALLAMLND